MWRPTRVACARRLPDVSDPFRPNHPYLPSNHSFGPLDPWDLTIIVFSLGVGGPGGPQTKPFGGPARFWPMLARSFDHSFLTTHRRPQSEHLESRAQVRSVTRHLQAVSSARLAACIPSVSQQQGEMERTSGFDIARGRTACQRRAARPLAM